MTQKTVLTEDDKREIVRRYEAGATQVDLAREFSCRFYAIKAIIQAASVTRKPLTMNTPIECRLHDALMAVGIGFTTQRRLVGRYVVDIVLHQALVVIEADGARHRIGTQAGERDGVRDVAHEAAGYRVFRFTGSEINTDAVKCIQKVIDACGLVPDKEPVYDIRTKFSGADHPRWADRFVEIACEYCGESFRARSDQERRFCSPRHYNLYCQETGVLKGKKRTPEQRERIAEANRARTGAPVSDETRAKISAARTGQPSPMKGKTTSPETRAKISASLTGHRDSAETRAKKSESRRGKKHSPETRAKISASHRTRNNQIKIESDPARDRRRPAETTGPATLF